VLLFLSYFSSQSKRINFGNYFFDVCCVNENILVRCQVPTTSYRTGITSIIEKFSGLFVDLNYFSFSHPNPNPTHLLKHESPSPNNKFCQRIWYVECYSVHAYIEWSQKFHKSDISLDTGYKTGLAWRIW